MNRTASKDAQSKQSNSDGDRAEGKKSSWVGTLFSIIPEFSQTWLTSMILHTGLIIGLALFTLTQIPDESITLAVGEVTPEVESVIEIPLEFEEEIEEPVEEFSELTESLEEEPVESESVSESLDSNLLADSDFGDLFADADLTEVLGSGVGEGDGETSLDDASKSAPKFFKSGTKANKIVYVVDNSNSMTGKDGKGVGLGRMETALIELAKSINSLEETQRFYIVFYSDTAYGLFHPYTETDYIAANSSNILRVNEWLDTVECCLKTNGTEAFEIARSLKPDLIYLLGDGAFTDGAHLKLAKRPIKGAVVEALGMNLQGKAAAKFKVIAEAHGGSYRDVGITPDGARILAQHGPRKRNSIRGPVWGIKLPATKKKKKK